MSSVAMAPVLTSLSPVEDVGRGAGWAVCVCGGRVSLGRGFVLEKLAVQ